MKRLTEGHLQEWSQRLNSIQDKKTHQVQARQGFTNFVSSFFVFSVVVLGRSQLMECFGLVHPVNDQKQCQVQFFFNLFQCILTGQQFF